MSIYQSPDEFCDRCGSRLVGGRCPNSSCPGKAVVPRRSEPPGRRSPATVAPQASSPYSGEWAAASQGATNDTYLGNRLLYRDEMKADMAGQASAGQLKGVLSQAVVFLAISVIVWFAVTAITFFGALSGQALNKSLGRVVFVGGQIIATLAACAVLIAFWFVPIREGISEWMIVLDDRAGAAGSAYAQIYGALVRRQTPAAVRPLLFKVASSGARRSFLEIRQGEYSAIVSVFAYGGDLFVGWTMWWTIYPGRLLWRVITQGTRGAKPSFAAAVGSDDVKALREVVHTATREGVDVAQMGISVDVEATFGSTLPVEQPL